MKSPRGCEAHGQQLRSVNHAADLTIIYIFRLQYHRALQRCSNRILQLLPQWNNAWHSSVFNHAGTRGAPAWQEKLEGMSTRFKAPRREEGLSVLTLVSQAP